MIWRTPNPFDYPDSLPVEDPLWNLLYSMFRTADQRPTMVQVVEEVIAIVSPLRSATRLRVCYSTLVGQKDEVGPKGATNGGRQ